MLSMCVFGVKFKTTPARQSQGHSLRIDMPKPGRPDICSECAGQSQQPDV